MFHAPITLTHTSRPHIHAYITHIRTPSHTHHHTPSHTITHPPPPPLTPFSRYAESGCYQGFADAHLSRLRAHLGRDTVFYSIFTEDETALPSRTQNPFNNFTRFIKSAPSPQLPALLRVMGPRGADDHLNCGFDWFLQHQRVDAAPDIRLPSGQHTHAGGPATLEPALREFFIEMQVNLNLWRAAPQPADSVTPGWRFLRRHADDPDWAMNCLPAMPSMHKKRHVL